MTEVVSSPSIDVRLTRDDRLQALRRDAGVGLARVPKELPSKWFYDARGSALFEEITRLPEYYLTRREHSILTRRAHEVAALAAPDTLIELGSGASEKTRLLLDAMVRTEKLVRFVAFDVSEPTLRESAVRIAREYPSLEVGGVVADFQEHLDAIPASEGRRLVAFLGSTIGNLSPQGRAAFLSDIRSALAHGDGLLLGTDLVKEPRRLEAAYKDAHGLTAAFNRNVLAVLNRELDADFVLERFEHVARYDAEREWIEMLLRSMDDQTVVVRDLGIEVEFKRAEEMRTEISAKFRRDALERELRSAGFQLARSWTDSHCDFAVSLAFVEK